MVSREDIIEKIGVLLKELSDKFEHISNPEVDIHPLEFQLFEVNAAYFAEHTSILRKLEEEREKSNAEADGADSKYESDKIVLTQVVLSAPPPVENQAINTPLEAEESETDEPVVFTPPTSDKDSEDEMLDSQETVEEISEEKSSSEETENQFKKENPKEEVKAAFEPSAQSQSNNTQSFFQPEVTQQEQEPAAESEPEPIEEESQATPNLAVNEEEKRGENIVEVEEGKNTSVEESEEPEDRNGGIKAKAIDNDEALRNDDVVNKVVVEEKKVNIANDRPMSLNERLSEQRHAAAGSVDQGRQYKETPQRIRDIKSTISLNDKLMFIKDLFNGYSLAYSEAIELLNRFESFEDADRFLKTNYAEKNSWETKQASVEKLYSILRKRYG